MESWWGELMRELPGNSNISHYSCEDLECVDAGGDDMLDGEQCQEYLIDFGTKVDAMMIGEDAAAYLEGTCSRHHIN